MTSHRADWMSEGKFGVMVHWIAPGPAPERGERITDMDHAVDRFDLDRFLTQFQKTGADWLIFTIGQNTGCYAGRNAVLDRLAGPGHCSRRDLVGEIARGVKAQSKRFITYLPAEVKAQSEAIHAAFAWRSADQSEFQRRYCAFIRDYAERLGADLDGWWFDGCYTWDDFHNSLYDWPAWCAAARAGNPQAALAFNDGSFCVGIEQPLTPLQDYLSGEIDALQEGKIVLGRTENAPLMLPTSRFAPGTECQWHALLPIDCLWGYEGPAPMPPPRYSDAELFSFVRNCRAVGGAVTLNVGIYQEGHMAALSVDQLSRLSASIG